MYEIEESLLRVMARVHKAPVIGPDKSLRVFIQREIYPAFEQLSAGESHITAFIGKPFSSKSTTRKSYIKLVGIHLRDPDAVGNFSWEEAEDRARETGKITTSKELPFQDEELEATNEEGENGLLELIGKFPEIALEVPVVTGAKVENRFIGRQLGFSWIYNLARREGIFSNLDNYTLSIVGLVPGARLREWAMSDFRKVLKHTTSLGEAQKIALDHGIYVPQTEQEWREISQGASPEQIEFIDPILSQVAERTRLHKPPRRPGIANVFANSIRYEASHIQYICEENFGMPIGTFFVGLSNPPITQKERRNNSGGKTA